MDKGQSPFAKLGAAALVGAVGYLFSCLVAAIGLALMIFAERVAAGAYSGPFGDFEFFSLVVMAVYLCLLLIPLAFPAFLGLRLILWALRRKDWPSFAGAGAICALVSAILMAHDHLSDKNLWQLIGVAVVGAIAGAAEGLSERRVMAWLLLMRAPAPNPEPGL